MSSDHLEQIYDGNASRELTHSRQRNVPFGPCCATSETGLTTIGMRSELESQLWVSGSVFLLQVALVLRLQVSGWPVAYSAKVGMPIEIRWNGVKLTGRGWPLKEG